MTYTRFSGSGADGVRRLPDPMGATNPDVTVANSAAALSGSFAGNLGVELLEIEDDAVTGRLLVDHRHLHPLGYVHGGVWVAFADTIAAWGTMRNLPAGQSFTTVELKVNVFAAGVAGDELIARGEPLHRGRLRHRSRISCS